MEEDAALATTPAPSTATPSKRVLHSIIHTGQSLSVGVQGGLAGSTPPLPFAFKLHDSTGKYAITKPNAECLSLVPLSEPLRQHAGPPAVYPKNIAGLTPATGMAAQIDVMYRSHGHPDEYQTIHSSVGISGAPMLAIEKDGLQNAYQASLFEACAIKRLSCSHPRNGDDVQDASSSFSSLSFDAIVLTHGETDSRFPRGKTPSYLESLLDMQADYVEDLRAISGQNHEPLLLLSQQNATPAPGRKRSNVVQDQWTVQHAAKGNGKIICVGPKYAYGYAPGMLHLHAAGYTRLGEKYGQVFYETVIMGRNWKPLSPKAVELGKDGASVVVRFHVPVPPLQWDERLPWPHQRDCSREGGGNHQYWKRGRGFEVVDVHGNALEIERVAISQDGESVVIHLSQPYGAMVPAMVAYAMLPDLDNPHAGESEGLIGHLCDSDATLSASAEVLECQVVHGSKEVFCEAGFGRRRAKYDNVEPGGYAVMDVKPIVKPRRVWLDRPWDGDSGCAKLWFGHSLKNHCVSFWMDIDNDGAPSENCRQRGIIPVKEAAGTFLSYLTCFGRTNSTRNAHGTDKTSQDV